MKTMMMTLVAILVTANTAFAGKTIDDKAVLNRFLRIEATKDLAGKKSCFKGGIKAKDLEMKDNYGGRYSSETPGIDLHLIAEENSRYSDKYCDRSLDKNRQPTEDDSKVAFRVCHHSYSSTYIVSAGYGFSTSGSYGTEAVLFAVNVVKSFETEVDMLTDEEIGDNKTRKVSTEITCQVVSLPETIEN